MIVEATAIPDSPKRMFYGIQSDGEPLFNNKQYHTTIVISNQNESNNTRYEGEIFIVPINGQEYVFSIGKGNNKYAELLDLNKCETKSQQLAITFFSATKIVSVLNYPTSFKVGDKYYFIFPFIDEGSNSEIFSIKKLYFSSTDIITYNPILKSYSYYDLSSPPCGRSTSCFVTDSNYIICLYNSLNFYFISAYTIGVYSSDLEKIVIVYPLSNNNNVYFPYYYAYDADNIFQFFSKCIYLEGETGLFIFYKATASGMNWIMDTYPIILFKTFDGSSSLNDYLSISEISLSQYTFNSSSLLNDIVKLSTTKLCFISTSSSKETLYIILLNIFNKKQVTTRLYTFDIFSKYTFKFLGEMRLHLYNNYAAFGFSFCRQATCETKVNPHYAGFMIFSYPNGTDYSLKVQEYFFDNNEINLEIDLKENIRIDNNVFGLIYSGIEIKSFNNCNNVNFVSSLNSDTDIGVDSILGENENIVVSFNSYNSVECQINFIYIITESDYDVYNSYCQRSTYGVDTEETSVAFNNQKDTYKSRVLGYSIIIEENLETQCTDINCKLCLESQKDFCIICKYNYTISNDNGIKKKNCAPIETTQIIDTTQPIETTQLIRTTQPIETTQIIDTTQPIETTQLIRTTQPIETIQIIDTTQPIETTQIKIDTTQIIETTEIKEDTTQSTEIIESEDTTEVATNNKNESEFCSYQEIVNNKCSDKKTSNEQVGKIYNLIKENILTEEYNGTNTVIQTENVIFQISTLEEQKNSENQNVSSIDIGECENILKKHYNISDKDDLIVIKTDIKSSDLSSIYVQYEIYDPNTLKQLNLSYCNEVKITVSVPVNLEDSTISLYERLSESGYNLFDSENEFYTDICSTYTSANGTDMTLADRKSEVLSATENISLCQSGCEFESYNSTTKKAKCNCDAQTNSTETNMTKIDFSSSSIATSFIDTLKNSNFLVMKCYKLAINLKNIFKNKGRIIMTIIYFIFIITLLIYIIIDRKKINLFINKIIRNKMNLIKLEKNKNKKGTEKLNLKNKIEKKLKNKSDIKDKVDKNFNKNKGNQKDKINKKDNKKKENKDKKGKKKVKNIKYNDKNNHKVKEPPKNKKKNNRKNLEVYNSTNKEFNMHSNANLKTKKNTNKININIIPINKISYEKIKPKNKNKNKFYNKIEIHKSKMITERAKINKIQKEFNLIDYKNLNDQELNNLEYNLALKIDKRTYFQYYWSLLKKKQLILFTILPANDYNLFSLKLALFLLSFSLYFTVNGFFFSDDTMHKIHEDNGAYNIIYQIPQILYSSVISAIINMVLKMLSLSEKNILELKQEKFLKTATNKSNKIETCILIKFISFFILSNVLLIFFWYFISCFCAVYTNTQKILITDTLVSFGLSMLYPFGLNLLPGMFRIPALRAKNKDKKCLYQISGLIALV